MNSNVVSLSGLSAGQQFNQLVERVGVCDWLTVVDQVRHAVKLPFTDVLERGDTALPEDAWPRHLGHATLEGFITQPHARQGLGMPWQSWVTHARAFKLKYTFGVHHDSPDAVLEEYRAVHDTLKREPMSAAEYHATKERSFRSQFDQTVKRHQIERSEMQEKVTDLMRQLDQRRATLEETRRELQHVRAQMADLDMARKAELDEQSRAMAEAHEAALATQATNLSSRFNAELADMQEQMAALRAHYNDDRFVSREAYQAVQGKLEQSESDLEASRTLIEELQQSLESGQAEKEALRRDVRVRDATIRTQEESLLALQAQIVDFEEMLAQVNEDEHPVRVQAIRRQLVRARERLAEYRDYDTELKARYQAQLRQRARDARCIKGLRSKLRNIQESSSRLRLWHSVGMTGFFIMFCLWLEAVL